MRKHVHIHAKGEVISIVRALAVTLNVMLKIYTHKF